MWKRQLPQPISRPKNVWERLQRDVRTAKVLDIERSIKSELDELIKKDTEAQRALWQEKSIARREGRKPDPKFARAWVEAGDAIAALRAEHGIHRPRPERNEYYYDPELAFSPARPPSDRGKGAKAVRFTDSSLFPRHP